MLTASHIQTALKAAGAGSGLVMPASEIATAFNDAILAYGDGQFTTKESVAALVSECMMESAYFRTTEEYAKNGRYKPFIGRTFIQITWRDNYLDFGKWCLTKGLVSTANYFVDSPKALAELKWAAIGGVWYFTQVLFHGKPLTFYTDHIDQVGKAVNLGNPFSSYVPAGHVARANAFKAVLKLGGDIVPVVAPPLPPVAVDPEPTPTPVPPKTKLLHSKQWNTDYMSWRGGNFAPITIEKLISIPSLVRITQGGLSFAPKSAMTHAGIGSGDIDTDGLTKDEVWQLSVELWQVDIIPCPRGFTYDSFQGRTIKNTNDGNEHLHFLDRDCYDSMHPDAQRQCREIMGGGDGLVGSASYTGPSRSNRVSWKNSKYNPANVVKPEDLKPGGTYVVVSNTLLGLDSNRVAKSNTLRQKGYEVNAVRLEKRWNRWNAVTVSDTYYAVADDKETYLELKEETK